MTTITESASPWRAATELAVAATPAPASVQTFDGDAVADDGFRLFGNDGFTFLDFIDIINPLQHIPVIGTLYRQFTDDDLDPGSRVIGGTLFFGPVGTLASVANVLVEDSTGMDIGEHVSAFLNEDGADAPETADAPARPSQAMVADAGSRSAYSAAAAVDPVTAWARSELAYRKAAAPDARPAAPGDQDISDVSAWTRSELAFRKSAAGDASPATATPAARDVSDVSAWTATWAAGREPTPTGRQTASLVGNARQDAGLFAAAYGRGQRAGGGGARSQGAGPSPGAIAQGGGWFSNSVQTALDQYRGAAGPAARDRATVIDLTR